MSTGSLVKKAGKIKNLNRFAELARLGEVVFHTDDLANLWHITKKNTLYTTIKRYVSDGLLIRIHKGFYAIKQVAEIDPLLLGLKAMHGYAYISCETILAEEGVVQQKIPVVTLLGTQTRRFTIGQHHYYARKLADVFLHQGAGIVTKDNGVRKATRERAIADLLYLNPRAYLDLSRLIDWKKVRAIQKALGYPLTNKYHTHRA